MEQDRPRPHRADFTSMHLPQSGAALRMPQTRTELLGYFAWGYLSRRELNDRLHEVPPSRKQAERQIRREPTRAA